MGGERVFFFFLNSCFVLFFWKNLVFSCFNLLFFEFWVQSKRQSRAGLV